MVNTEIRLIIFFAAEVGKSSIHSAKTKPGADCGSDHELLLAKFSLKLKKAEKTTRHQASQGNHPKEKEMQEVKWQPEEALQIAEERNEVKSK